MDSRLAPAEIGANEVPEGFTTADPTGKSSGNNGSSDFAASKKAAAAAQKESILEQALTPEALARLRRVKLVKPETAAMVERKIVSMALQGALTTRCNEGKVIEMLEGLVGEKQKAAAPKISIQRKRYAFDDDDDDDNDDDLL
eukprot:CAMPEP_0118695656 /NCGR_PEP_ID=MMETSP0800-20121206/13329_1 /TAXON_ID=210618 ORGANISM="Striatella unipunctata, Strain CCMP2910" /NCGR_SAMPLE_ID=MMETSP0800 /ASSEMBLY_ACC=CAM_ASM_000638 /LENGTH=142 /DNA_ID=CAMNT_0006594515 /DNA_START=88 /DNA_END=516 /DNA_ORIENTATION=+